VINQPKQDRKSVGFFSEAVLSTVALFGQDLSVVAMKNAQ
jgi:hypothetical protein